MNRNFVRQVNLGLRVALLLLLLNAVVSYRNILKLIDNERRVSQSHQTIAQLEAVLSILKDAETGQRGYLLTGETQYLEPYIGAIAQVDQQIQTLRQREPALQPQIDTLKEAIAAKFTELDQTIRLRQTTGLEAALQVVRSDRGKQIMDDVRRQIATITYQENQRLIQRVQESQRTLNATVLTLTLVNGISLLLLVIVATALRYNEKQRQQTELVLQEREERLRVATEFAQVGTWDWNVITNKVAWNDEHFRLLGLVPHSCQLSYQKWRDRVHPDDIEQTEQAVQQAIANRATYSAEYRVIWQDGSVHWLVGRGRAIYDEMEKPTRLLGIILDISERKQAEMALYQLNITLEQRVGQRTAQLEEINQELQSFTYSVSHDLRAPLRIMQGFAQALQEDYGTQLDQIAQTYIASITDSAVQMDDLINDLLEYSRLSQTQLDLQPTSLADAIAIALQQLQSQIHAAQAVITVAPDLPVAIAHRPTLIQVITNLISNAIKFVEPGVQPQIVITSETDQGWVRLWVKDNGIGIAAEHQQRIFRVFERLHGVETYPGTGIGLAIAQKGIERMGGQIGVVSFLGGGSRFWIALPLGPPAT